MAQLSPKLRSVVANGAGDNGIAFWCPGCDSAHVVAVEGPHAWSWDGKIDAPTLRPSVLVTYNGEDAGKEQSTGHRAPPARCHSFVRAGQIEFLADSTHELSGRKVPLPDWP